MQQQYPWIVNGGNKGFFLIYVVNCQCFFDSRKAILASGLLPVSLKPKDICICDDAYILMLFIL